MPLINHIVCPVDMSPSTRPLLAFAATWARWYDADLHVLHAVPPPEMLGDPTVDFLPSSLAALDHALQLAGQVDGRIEVLHVLETAGDEEALGLRHCSVPEYHAAREHEALVELRRHIPGRATDRVLRVAHAPVLIVPASTSSPNETAVEYD